MATQIKWRRDTAANWATNNTHLAQGEPGFETDTGKFKIGDGTTIWNSLSYASNMSGAEAALAGLFTDVGGSDPSTPTSNKMKLYTKAIAGRMMLKHIALGSAPTALQPHFARNKIGYWNPQGNSVTLPAIFGGFTSYTTVGTTTAANVSISNLFSRMRRVSFVTTVATGSLASFRVSIAQIQLGDGSGNAGFYKIIRFGCSDVATTSGARQFCGINANTNAPTNVEPNTIVNCVGIGHGAADTTMHLFYGGSVAQTPIDLGANFPANTLSVDVYELALFSPASEFATVYYEVTRVNTGDVVTGVIVGDGAGIMLPTPYTLLSYSWNFRTNNAAAQAVSIDIMSDYIETDN